MPARAVPHSRAVVASHSCIARVRSPIDTGVQHPAGAPMNVTVTAAQPSIGSLATGIDGLDDILGGGYAGSHIHLIEGQPGSGKTTLALQFLRDGNARGERTLYITLSETRSELLA